MCTHAPMFVSLYVVESIRMLLCVYVCVWQSIYYIYFMAICTYLMKNKMGLIK